MRSLIAFESIVVVDPALLLRAVEVYEIDRLDFAEAYLVACAESTGVDRVAWFDQAIDRVDTVRRVEPPAVRRQVPQSWSGSIAAEIAERWEP